MKYLNKLSLRNAPRGALLLMPFPLLAVGGLLAGSSALNAGVGQLLGRSNMSRQAELQRENMNLANEQNRRNALEQGVMQRMATQGAGLNVNADKGAFQVAGSSALPVQAQQNPQVSDGVGMAQAILGAQDSESRYNLNKGLEYKAYAEGQEALSRVPGNYANSEMLQQRADRYAEILGIEVEQGKENVNLTKEQQLSEQKKRAEMEHNIKLMLAKIDEVNASAKLLGEQTAFVQMEKVWKQKEYQAHISELYALADYHKKAGDAAYATAKANIGNAIANLQDAITRAFTAPSEKAKNDAEAEIAKIQKELTEKYGDAEKVSGLIGGIIGTAATAFLAGGVLRMGGKALYKGTKIGFTAK